MMFATVLVATLGWSPVALPGLRQPLPRSLAERPPASPRCSEAGDVKNSGLGLGANNARILLGVVAATYGTNYACVKELDDMIGSPVRAVGSEPARANAAACQTTPACISEAGAPREWQSGSNPHSKRSKCMPPLTCEARSSQTVAACLRVSSPNPRPNPNSTPIPIPDHLSQAMAACLRFPMHTIPNPNPMGP